MRVIKHNIKPGEQIGQETREEKIKNFDAYIELLKREGEEILEIEKKEDAYYIMLK